MFKQAKSQPPLSKTTTTSSTKESDTKSKNGRGHSGGGSGSNSEKKSGSSTIISLKVGVASGVRGVVTNCVYLQSGRRDESKSSSRSETERGRRSMEVRKSSTSERDRDRRKSAPGPVPRRYVAYAVFLLRIRQYFAYSLKFKLFNTSFSGLVVAAVSVVYVSGLPLAPLHLEGAPLLT